MSYHELLQWWRRRSNARTVLIVSRHQPHNCTFIIWPSLLYSTTSPTRCWGLPSSRLVLLYILDDYIVTLIGATECNEENLRIRVINSSWTYKKQQLLVYTWMYSTYIIKLTEMSANRMIFPEHLSTGYMGRMSFEHLGDSPVKVQYIVRIMRWWPSLEIMITMWRMKKAVGLRDRTQIRKRKERVGMFDA
jgi:hypothetical protein